MSTTARLFKSIAVSFFAAFFALALCAALPALAFAEGGGQPESGSQPTPSADQPEPISDPAPQADAVAKIGDTPYATLKEAIEAANAANKGATITLLTNATLEGDDLIISKPITLKGTATITLGSDVVLANKTTIAGNITIEGQRTLQRADSYTGTFFAVNSGATLTLDGDLTIDGGNNYAFDKDGLISDCVNRVRVYKADSAKWFTPEEGAPVATAFMMTTKGGTINLNKVTIQNNYSTSSGVVLAEANSTINLNGATITHIASTQGNGVAVNASGANIAVNMYDGTKIDGNHAGANHGMFKVYSGTVFTMYGGEITNNTACNSNGTVVGIYWGSFYLKGGKICTNYGVYGENNGRNSAIYGHSGHVFVMSGGSICHNSGAYGGLDAPYNNGQTEITGGSVVDNVSTTDNPNCDVNAGEQIHITGGQYSQDITHYLAPGEGEAYNPETGEYEVTEKIAELNGVTYSTIREAVAAAKDGDTITIIANHRVDCSDPSVLDAGHEALILVKDKKITIDLNGHEVYMHPSQTNDNEFIAAFYISGDAFLTLTDSSENNKGMVYIVPGSSHDTCPLIYLDETGDDAGFLIKDGTYDLKDVGEHALIYAHSGANCSIAGGTFDLVKDGTTASPWLFSAYGDNAAPLTIRGGLFNVDPQAEHFGDITIPPMPEICEIRTEVVDNVTMWRVIPGVQVSFESNGGTELETYLIKLGKTITKPEDPTRAGYVFAGWYSDSALKQAFDFSVAPQDDVVLYAKWTQPGGGSGSSNALAPTGDVTPVAALVVVACAAACATLLARGIRRFAR